MDPEFPRKAQARSRDLMEAASHKLSRVFAARCLNTPASGRSLGGHARAAALSSDRSAQASAAAKARWAKTVAILLGLILAGETRADIIGRPGDWITRADTGIRVCQLNSILQTPMPLGTMSWCENWQIRKPENGERWPVHDPWVRSQGGSGPGGVQLNINGKWVP